MNVFHAEPATRRTDEELHDELRARGFDLSPGDMGENVTTLGVDLLALQAGTRLRIGRTAVIEVAGLQNPCVQLDHFQDGLVAAFLERDDQGRHGAQGGGDGGGPRRRRRPRRGPDRSRASA